MIVADDTVSKALQYLAEDPHPIALARKDVVDAENEAKRIWSKLFLAETGSVEARKAAAECHPSYAEAKAAETGAILELERHKARTKAAEMLISVWQSENANARAAERVR